MQLISTVESTESVGTAIMGPMEIIGLCIGVIVIACAVFCICCKRERQYEHYHALSESSNRSQIPRPDARDGKVSSPYYHGVCKHG